MHSVHPGIVHGNGFIQIDYAVVSIEHAQQALDIFSSRTCLAPDVEENSEVVRYCTRPYGHQGFEGWAMSDVRTDALQRTHAERSHTADGGTSL